MNSLPIPTAVQQLARDASNAIRERLGNETPVIWFGSWITGQPTERSDIDLGVDLGREFTDEERVAVAAAIEGLPTLRGIDVVDLRAVSPKRRETILQEGHEL